MFVQKKRRGGGGSTAAASKTKSKGGVSSETASAFSLFESIYEQHKDCVAALLGLAMLFTVEGQDQKARNMLKQIVKKPYQVSPSYQGYVVVPRLVVPGDQVSKSSSCPKAHLDAHLEAHLKPQCANRCVCAGKG